MLDDTVLKEFVPEEMKCRKQLHNEGVHYLPLQCIGLIFSGLVNEYARKTYGGWI
jgi:hypothetical protein